MAIPGEMHRSAAMVRTRGWVLTDTQLELLPHLIKADDGVEPRFLDNSSFVRVAAELEGKQVSLVHMYDLQPYVVLDQNEAVISSETLQPLAWEKWGHATPPPRRGRGSMER